MEIPFAGHPNIGTAFALAGDGELGEIGDGITVAFEEAAGVVPISIQRDARGRIQCELAAPQALSLGAVVDAARIAAVLSLEPNDIATSTHQPQVASVGLPFLFVELATRDALQRARIDMASLGKLRDTGIPPDIHIYVRSNDGFDIRARMFAPFDGVPEDPATGSANCALAALLTHSGVGNPSGDSWRIAQGVEMGRPSTMDARSRRDMGIVTAWIGGHCVLIGEGTIVVD
jgi:trans-2,3-dihydro-3-hydroxyanthranilate isomerase